MAESSSSTTTPKLRTSQITVYEFPKYQLVWEHKAGLNIGLNGRSWGMEWSGTEGTIILNMTAATKSSRSAREPTSILAESTRQSRSHVQRMCGLFWTASKSRQKPVLEC